jgi:hypothetical protein
MGSDAAGARTSAGHAFSEGTRRTGQDIRNYIRRIKKIHSGLGVTIPVIFIVRLYKWIKLFIEFTHY